MKPDEIELSLKKALERLKSIEGFEKVYGAPL
ncbi:hypothetical protein METP1_01319 [Methanosarcinales archaeon]|nr:hypothetical protein METP1_01319 [Methanosarcinales archaeon]